MSMKLTKTPSRPPYDRNWLDYHREMESKYRYFVRSDEFDPFYTDGTFDEIISHLKDAPMFEILDNNWESAKWDTQPYKYRITKRGNYEYFGHPQNTQHTVKYSNPLAIRLNGVWRMKYYRDNGRSFYWSMNGWCSAITADGVYNRSESGKWMVWRGSKVQGVNNMPQDALLPNIRGMKATKWRGFFNDIVAFLINDGLDKRYL